MAKSAVLLKDYLIRLDFHYIYKYLVGGNNYILNPAIITNESKAFFLCNCGKRISLHSWICCYFWIQ